MKTRTRKKPETKCSLAAKPGARVSDIPPRQQPGGEVLSSIQAVTFRWTRGEIFSDQAIEDIAELVNESDWFYGSIRCHKCE